VIVGLGLNVNLNPATAFGDRGEPVVSYSTGQPAIPKDTATSLSQILGRDTADLREPLLQAFLGGVDRLYHDFLFQGYTPHRAANDKLIGSNQAVIIYDSGGQILHQGIIAGLDEKCSLLLRQSDGRMESILSGELTLRSASKS
jgi:biotin-(acetyl-CoA carboxylase) ligase